MSTRVAGLPLALLMVSCCLVTSQPAVAGDADAKPVPVGSIPGAREVQTRDAHGRLDVFTSIPEGSKFGSEGGPGRPCSAWVPDTGPAAVPGESTFVDSMNWIFIEGQAFASSASYPIFDSKDRTLPSCSPVADCSALWARPTGCHQAVPRQGSATSTVSNTPNGCRVQKLSEHRRCSSSHRVNHTGRQRGTAVATPVLRAKQSGPYTTLLHTDGAGVEAATVWRRQSGAAMGVRGGTGCPTPRGRGRATSRTCSRS